MIRGLLVCAAILPIEEIEAAEARERAWRRCARARRRHTRKDAASMTKILLVDDSKFLRMAMERALARAGYSVSTAADGECALELARREKPDLILLDMLLPKISGPEVLKALKKDPATKRIAVIVLTGLSQKNESRLRQDGACAFLEKAELGLDKGCEAFLVALAGIIRELKLDVRARAREAGARV